MRQVRRRGHRAWRDGRRRPPPNRFVILNVVAGGAALESAAGEIHLPIGSTVLIPASLPPYKLRGDGATVLRSYVP